jgi:hypothetical protein
MPQFGGYLGLNHRQAKGKAIGFSYQRKTSQRKDHPNWARVVAGLATVYCL